MSELVEIKRLRDYYENALSWESVQTMTGRRAYELLVDHLDMVIQTAEDPK